MITRSLILVLTLGACGGVHPIDVHDERLPLEARLWVGGAEDALAIARAAVQDARLELEEVEAWANDLPSDRVIGLRSANRPQGGNAAVTGLLKPLGELAEARITVSEKRLDRARAELALAAAGLDLVYAETDMRYDLGVHDLAALRATRDDAKKDLDAIGARVDEAMVQLDKVATDFWSAYRAQASGGGTDALLWLAVPSDRGAAP